jgi:formate hydrogenlyase subunit 6/NADH:ubiquinone oxidoreductase subunit I
MTAWLLDDISTLLAHLGKQRQLFAPRHSGGDLHWLPLDATNEPSLDDKPLLPLSSPKSFFFAERETLFKFDGRNFIETLPEIKPQALIGVRSCDLCAISYQDQFFAQDPYYKARRSATLLVGLDCNKPCDGGFCPTVNAGPFVSEGMADLILQRSDNDWLLIAATTKGKETTTGLPLPPAPLNWQSQRTEREHSVSARFPHAMHIESGIQQINSGTVSAETWAAMGLQCLSCSGCTSLCPSCSCFATFEQPTEETANGFQRERCWDSCLYEAFQREASGHNPSAQAGVRVERFWFHKFSDDYVETFGRYGCVGCGRCERICPGVIGVHSVMERISSES